MKTFSMNDTADNGFSIHSSVELLWSDDEPFADLPFRVITMVNGTAMFTAHRKTNSQAKTQAEKMHMEYLRVHSSALKKAKSTRV